MNSLEIKVNFLSIRLQKTKIKWSELSGSDTVYGNEFCVDDKFCQVWFVGLGYRHIFH